MNSYQKERQQQAITIIKHLKERLPDVFNIYPVNLAYLYGSMARQSPLPTSDVDIALVLNEVPANGKELLSLEFTIQAALEDACDLSNLDVRTINNAPLMVRGEIVQAGILLYERNRATRIAFEVLTRELYFDYRPTAKWMEQAFLNHIHQNGLSYEKSNHRDRIAQ